MTAPQVWRAEKLSASTKSSQISSVLGGFQEVNINHPYSSSFPPIVHTLRDTKTLHPPNQYNHISFLSNAAMEAKGFGWEQASLSTRLEQGGKMLRK